MADLAITAANVVAGSNAVIDRGHNAGEMISAGMPLYLDASTHKWLKADSNSATAAAKTAGGISLNGASLNQPVAVQTGGRITIGATLTAGEPYFLSETAGGIQPYADLGTGENVCQIGVAHSTTELDIDFQTPGVTHA